MRKLFTLFMTLFLVCFALPAAAEEMSDGEPRPIALPVFETETFLMTDARWTRPNPEKYWYTFKGTGMDAKTILSLMAETGHTLVDCMEAPLTQNPDNPGVCYQIYYTYNGSEQLSLFPFGSPAQLLSVQISFFEYENGSRKMTLFCAKELMYEPE